jgi:RimJ/RimL family protein N-acetyltransferase
MIQLKEMKKNDLELVLAWRSIPEVYHFLYTQKEPLNWDEHKNWFENRKNRIDWIIIYNGRKIGVMNIIHLDTECPELGIYIGELKLWGKGVGKQVVIMALNWMKRKRFKMACATTNKENIRSQGMWESLGFKKKGTVKDGTEWLYVLEKIQ